MGPSKRKSKTFSPSQIHESEALPSAMLPPKRKSTSTSPSKPHEPHSAESSKPPPSTSINSSLFTIQYFQLGTSSPIQPSDIYVVRPTAIWDSLTHYGSCIVNDQSLTFNDDITLTRPSHPGLWTARILEVRGSDEKHVYLRLYYYYKPSQLPSDIRYETNANGSPMLLPLNDNRVLLASNDMEIVNASVVEGKFVLLAGRGEEVVGDERMRFEERVRHVWAGERADDLPVGPYWMHRFDARRGVVVSGGELDYGDLP